MFTRPRVAYFTIRLRNRTTILTPETFVPRESYHLYTVRLSIVTPLPSHCQYDYETDEIVNGIALHFEREGFTVKTQRMNRRKFESVPFCFSEAIGDISYVYPDISGIEEGAVRVSKTGRTNYQLLTGTEVGQFPLLAKIATENVWVQAARLILKSGNYLNTDGVCADTIVVKVPLGWEDLVDLTIVGWT